MKIKVLKTMVAMLLSISFLFNFAACGEKEGDKNDSSENMAAFDSEVSEEDFELFKEMVIKITQYKHGEGGYLPEFDSETATTQFILENVIHHKGIGDRLISHFFKGNAVNQPDGFANMDEYYEFDPLDKFGSTKEYDGEYSYLGGLRYESDGNIFFNETGLRKYPTEDFKWVCENVFNVTYDASFSQTDEYLSEKVPLGGIYLHEDFVYSVTTMQYCDTFSGEVSITDKKTENGKFVLTVELLNEEKSGNTFKDKKYIITTELKEKDGNKYWSFYKIEECK